MLPYEPILFCFFLAGVLAQAGSDDADAELLDIYHKRKIKKVTPLWAAKPEDKAQFRSTFDWEEPSFKGYNYGPGKESPPWNYGKPQESEKPQRPNGYNPPKETDSATEPINNQIHSGVTQPPPGGAQQTFVFQRPNPSKPQRPPNNQLKPGYPQKPTESGSQSGYLPPGPTTPTETEQVGRPQKPQTGQYPQPGYPQFPSGPSQQPETMGPTDTPGSTSQPGRPQRPEYPSRPGPQQPQPGYPPFPGIQGSQTSYPQQPESQKPTSLYPQPGYPQKPGSQPQHPGSQRPQPGFPQQPQPGYPQPPQQPQPEYPQQPGSQRPQPGFPQQPQKPQPGYPQQPGSQRPQPQPGYPQQPQPGYPQFPQPGYPQQPGSEGPKPGFPQQPQPGYPQPPQQPQPEYPQQPGSQRPQPGFPQQPQKPQPGYPQQPGSQRPQPQPGYPQQPQPGYPQQPGSEGPKPGFPQQPQPGYPQQPGSQRPQPQPGYPQPPQQPQPEYPQQPGPEGPQPGYPQYPIYPGHPFYPQIQPPIGPGEVVPGLNMTASEELRKYCKAPRGQFGTERSCSSFVNCWDDMIVEQECGGGLLFNEDKKYCDYPDNVDCMGRPITKPFAPNDGNCQSSFGTFRSTTNCAEFFVCVHGVANRFICPGGTAYNSDLGVCDYPYRVDCNGIPLIPAEVPEEMEYESQYQNYGSENKYLKSTGNSVENNLSDSIVVHAA